MSVIGASANRFNHGGLTGTRLQQPLILRSLLQLRFTCIIMCVFFLLVMAVITVCEDISAKKKRGKAYLVWGQLRLTELILSFLITDQIWSIQKHSVFPFENHKGNPGICDFYPEMIDGPPSGPLGALFLLVLSQWWSLQSEIQPTCDGWFDGLDYGWKAKGTQNPSHPKENMVQEVMPCWQRQI